MGVVDGGTLVVARRSITWLGRLACRSARFDHNGSVGRHAFVLLGAQHALCVPHVTAATLNRLTQEQPPSTSGRASKKATRKPDGQPDQP